MNASQYSKWLKEKENFKNKLRKRNAQIKDLKEQLKKFKDLSNFMLKQICDKDCNNCNFIDDCREYDKNFKQERKSKF